MNHSISILITYHDEKELLTDCLNSLKGQLDSCDEILIYDDASKVPPQRFIPRGINARVLRGDTNRGPAYGRNVLLSKARGEYIHFHDADDWFSESWARRIRRVLIATPCDVIFTEVSSYQKGQVVSSEVLGLKSITSPDKLLPFCIEHFMLVPAGTYRRTLIQKMGGYREDLWQSEDFDFHVRLANLAPKFEIILEPLVSIRLRPESRSQKRDESLGDAVKAIDLLRKEVPQQYHQTLAQKAARLGSELFEQGYRKKAREAFKLAKALGHPTFEHKPGFYQKVAETSGQEIAEWVSLVYRKIIPESMRRNARNKKSPEMERSHG